MFNIQIASTGEFLELYPKERISFEIQNPFFYSEIRGSFTYSFKIPYSPQNIKALGNAGFLASTTQRQEKEQVRCYIDVNIWFIGVLQIKNALAYQYISIQIDVDFGDFRSKIGDLDLKEVVTQTYTLPRIDLTYKYFWFGALEPTTTPQYDTISYTIFVNAVQKAGFFVKAVGTIIQGGILACFEELAKQINELPDPKPFRAYATYWQQAEQAVLYLLPYINNYSDAVTMTTTTDGTAINQNFENRFQQQINPVPEYDDFVFPEIYFEDFYDGKNEDFLKVINRYANVGGFYNRNTPIDMLNRDALSPQLKLFRVLEYIADAAGYTVTGEFFEDVNLAKLIIANSYAIDQGLVSFDNQLGPNLGVYLKEINTHNNWIVYADHLPDMTVNEILNQIQQLFCVYTRFNIRDKTMELRFKKNRLVNVTSNSSDWSDKLVISVENIVQKKNIKLQFSTTNFDSFFFQSVKAGNYDETEIYESKAGTLEYSQSYPAISRMDGNSPMFGLGTNNDFPLAFLFWHGLIDQKPVATAKEMPNFPYTLLWNGSKGLYEIFWKDYITFILNHKECDAICWLDENTAKMIIDRIDDVVIRYDNLYFFIRKMRFDVVNSSNPFSGGATAELVKYSV